MTGGGKCEPRKVQSEPRPKGKKMIMKKCKGGTDRLTLALAQGTLLAGPKTRDDPGVTEDGSSREE